MYLTCESFKYFLLKCKPAGPGSTKLKSQVLGKLRQKNLTFKTCQAAVQV